MPEGWPLVGGSGTHRPSGSCPGGEHFPPFRLCAHPPADSAGVVRQAESARDERLILRAVGIEVPPVGDVHRHRLNGMPDRVPRPLRHGPRPASVGPPPGGGVTGGGCREPVPPRGGGPGRPVPDAFGVARDRVQVTVGVGDGDDEVSPGRGMGEGGSGEHARAAPRRRQTGRRGGGAVAAGEVSHGWNRGAGQEEVQVPRSTAEPRTWCLTRIR